MNFTEANVKSFPVDADKADHYEWDESMKGFGVRVQFGGSRTYVIKYRIGEKQRKVKIGAVEQISLVKAKLAAKQMFAKVATKIDPVIELKKATVEAGQTFGLAIVPYLAKMESENAPSYHAANKKYLEEHFKKLHGMPLASIDHATIARGLATITKERGPIAANRAGAAASAFFNWAIREGLRSDRVNPAGDTNKNKEKHRDRTLTERELKIIWHGVPDNEFGDIVKLFMLTMQRRDEVGGLPTAEFNRAKRQLEIEGSRFKNTNSNTIPLSDLAFDIVDKHYNKDRKFIFGRIDTGFSGWSKAKAELDEALKGITKPWIFHDFRRTGKTIMEEELDVPDNVSEAILNHAKKGLGKVYNTAKYIRKKRDALDQYAAHITKVVA